MHIRELTELDAKASAMASREAFGGPPDAPVDFVNSGIHRWGIFDGELLAAKASDREYVSMIGGCPVTTAGAAGPLEGDPLRELATGAGAIPAAALGRRAAVAPPSSIATAAHRRIPAASSR